MRLGQVTVATSLASVSASPAELEELADTLARRLQACASEFADEHAVGVQTRVARETHDEIKARVLSYGPRTTEGSG
jgi:hypothetical protein